MDMMMTCNQNERIALRKDMDGVRKSFAELLAASTHLVTQFVSFAQYAADCVGIAENILVS